MADEFGVHCGSKPLPIGLRAGRSLMSRKLPNAVHHDARWCLPKP